MMATTAEVFDRCGLCSHRGPHDRVTLTSDGSARTYVICAACDHRWTP